MTLLLLLAVAWMIRDTLRLRRTYLDERAQYRRAELRDRTILAIIDGRRARSA